MENRSTLLTTWMTLATMTLLGTSCQKALDYSKDKGKGQADNTGCNISRITVHPSTGGQASIVYTFTYNTAGDPVTVKNSSVATGNPNTVFKYDRYGRMSEMIRPYDNGQFETWTKFFYNNDGLIVRDTQYVMGSYVDSIPKASPRLGYWVTQFTYDGLDRIVGRTDSSFSFGSRSGSTTLYHYDTNGNITGGGGYDAHLNFLHTNKIWMFLANNYSLNNHFQASGYNDHELPLAFQAPSQVMAPVVNIDGRFEVEYTCQPLPPNQNSQGNQNQNSQK